MIPLRLIMIKHETSFHCFADAIKMYLPVTANESHFAVKTLQDCLMDVQGQSAHFLKAELKVRCLSVSYRVKFEVLLIV